MHTKQLLYILSEMFSFRAAFKPRLPSYDSKLTSQSLSDTLFVYLMHNLKTMVIYGHSTYQTTALLSETFLLWFTIELHERSIWRAVASDTHHGHSLIQHSVYTMQPCTYIAIWCTTTHDNKTHIAYNCTTSKTMALLPTMHF